MSSGGEQLGRYHLVRKLATGGMAEVFLAKVVGPGGFEKSLVIKRILPNLAKDPEFVSMFLQEARLAAQFAHPAVVQIFDFGEVNGSYFLAMEYIDGPNLRNILRASPEKRIPLAIGARIIEHACEGLAYVHEFADGSGQPMGLMHCDVSTDNMLIARNGAVKVVDFGVAKASGQAGSEPGVVKGKIAYMPPEQIIGEADLRADVYALGVILYEIAAGTRPYEYKSDQQLLESIIKTDPVPLSKRRPDVPREYALIVEKAMAKNLSVRFQNCREFAAALDDFIAGSGERVTTRQLAALATQHQEAPEAGASPSSATPFGKQAPAAQISPPKGLPVTTRLPPPPPMDAPDPFAAFGAPVKSKQIEDLTAPDPFAAFAPLSPVPVTHAPPPPPAAAPPAKKDPFAAFGKPTSAMPQLGGKRATPVPIAPPRPATPAPPKPPVGVFDDLFNDLVDEAVDEDEPIQGLPLTAPTPSPAPAPQSSPSKPPSASPSAVAPPPAPKPPPAPPAPVHPPNSPEARAVPVLAAASVMRVYEPGPLISSPAELEALASEFERDEGLFLLVRFARQAGRLLKNMDQAESLIHERVVGAVEGLLLAEAYGPLATLLSALQHSASIDSHHKSVLDLAMSIFCTEDQAKRLAMRLREAPPVDVDGLGKLIPFFGGAFATLWLNLFETLDLPSSRDAVLPGLAGLAAKNSAPFVERLEPKRPRRLTELVYCLEKGRAPERHKLIKDLLARLDAQRKREVILGLAKAGTDDAFRVVSQGIADEVEETRLLSIQLQGKHFPDRVFQVLEPLLTPSSLEGRSEPIRRALWVAVAHSTQPAAFEAIVKELAQKPSLLNRAKIETRKLDALDGLAAVKDERAEELMRKLSKDSAQTDDVRAAADRHVRSALLIKQTTTTPAGESRRWERAPGTWRDVLLDLHSLAAASRLIDVAHPAFDVAFHRLASRQSSLMTNGKASITINPRLMVDGQPVSEGADAAIDRATAAFKSRHIGSFAFVRHAPRADLEQLVRWLAAGAGAEGLETPSITRTLSTAAPPKPAQPLITLPTMSDVSREAMIRYVELILSFRGWLKERQTKPLAAMPEVRQAFHELAAAVSTRQVRLLGLTPKARNRDAELFHAANVMLLSLVFGAELGLPAPRLIELASFAFFTDIGNLGLKDETLEKAGKLTDEEQADVTAAKKWSQRFPFVRLNDQPGAVAWATVVAEQEIDWGHRERPGALGAEANVGLMGSLVAIARAYETLTCATGTREAMSRDQALELMTTKAAHRFRPELLALFAKFIKRQSARPLA